MEYCHLLQQGFFWTENTSPQELKSGGCTLPVIPDRQWQIPVSTASNTYSCVRGVLSLYPLFVCTYFNSVTNLQFLSEFPDLLKHNNCKASHIIPSLAYGQCYPDRIGQPWAPLHKDCWHGSRRRGVLSGWITTACVVRVFSQWIVMPTTYLSGTFKSFWHLKKNLMAVTVKNIF